MLGAPYGESNPCFSLERDRSTREIKGIAASFMIFGHRLQAGLPGLSCDVAPQAD